MSMTARTLTVLSAALIAGLTRPALAQNVFNPQFGPVMLANPPPDPNGASQAVANFIASSPLRLTLQASVFPMAGPFPNCASREEAAGNTVGGIPVTHYAELRVTSHLVLSGFSQLGCPIDAGLGAALTYTQPIARSLWLVFGAGIYGAPGQIPLYGGLSSTLASGFRGYNAAVNVGVHANVLWKTNAGHFFTVGVGSMGRGRQGITFGGGF
jgi:hypothetical protein